MSRSNSASIRSAETQVVENEAVSFDYSEGMQPSAIHTCNVLNDLGASTHTCDESGSSRNEFKVQPSSDDSKTSQTPRLVDTDSPPQKNKVVENDNTKFNRTSNDNFLSNNVEGFFTNSNNNLSSDMPGGGGGNNFFSNNSNLQLVPRGLVMQPQGTVPELAPANQQQFIQSTAQQSLPSMTPQLIPQPVVPLQQSTLSSQFPQPMVSSQFQQPMVSSQFKEPIVSSQFQQPMLSSQFQQPIQFQQAIVSSQFPQPMVSSQFQQPMVPSQFLHQPQFPQQLLVHPPLSPSFQYHVSQGGMIHGNQLPFVPQSYIAAQQLNQLPPSHLLPHSSHERKRSQSLSPTNRIQAESHGTEYPPDTLVPPAMLHRSKSDPKDTVVHSGTESYKDLLASNEIQSTHNFFEIPEVQHKLKREIGIPTMTYFVHHVVRRIPNKWRDFGYSLGIESPVLDGIERKYSGRDPQQCFIEVFCYWESNKNDLPSFFWSTVADLLENEIINERDLANRIRFLSPTSNQAIIHQTDSYPQSLPSSLNQPPQAQVMHPSTLPTSSKVPSNVIPSPNLPYQVHQPSLISVPNTQVDFSSLPSQLPTTVPHSIQPVQQQSNNFFETLSSVPTATMASFVPMVTPVPVSSSSGVVSSQVIQLSTCSIESVQSYNQEKSSSSFYSAAEEGPSSFQTKQDSWAELLQKYMSKLEERSTHPPFIRPSSPSEHCSISPQVVHKHSAKPAKEEKSYLQKELEKAYERISSLEVRVQDLTAQVTCDIPEDNELSQLPLEKLDHDFRRMRELKKKAEQQSMDAKQAAQRLVAENFRLKEELSQVKNDRDMLVLELRRQKRKTTENEHFRGEKMESMKKSLHKAVREKLKDFEGELSTTGHSVVSFVKDFPAKEFTPKLLWDVITKEKSSLHLGQVAVVGLPCSGKSTLVKALLQKEIGGSNFKSKGQPTSVEFYEIMIPNDPLTGDSHWKVVSEMDCAVQYLSTVCAQYFFHQKRTPSFIDGSISESIDTLFPSPSNSNIKDTFTKVFKGVQSILQKEKRKDGLVQLALNQPTFVNIWDIGVNRCLYQLLPEVASFCEHLVVLDVINLERDVPELDEPPVLTNETYKQREDDKYVMQLYSRLEYFMLFAGIKHWLNNESDEVPEATYEIVVVGTHTIEFAERKEGKALRESITLLKTRVSAVANKFGLHGVIDPCIITYCIDGDRDRQDKDLTVIKNSIEKLVRSQSNCEVPVDVNWMFFRSLFYNYTNIAAPRHLLRKDARACGIYGDVKLHNCLLAFRNVGSLVYVPEIESSFSNSHVLWNIPLVLEMLDKIFYLRYYQSSNTINLSDEDEPNLKRYQCGLLSKTLVEKVATKQNCQSLLEYIACCNICVNVTVGQETDLYFLPSLRTSYRNTKPHSSSLYVVHCTSHYAFCDHLVIFPQFFHKVFSYPDQVDFTPCKDFNVLTFHCITGGKEADVEIVYHPRFIEIHVPSCGSGIGKNLLNLALCSKLKQLCTLVYDHVCAMIYNLTYQFNVLCPNSSETSDPHFIVFNGDELKLFCDFCKEYILINDERSNWLMSRLHL